MRKAYALVHVWAWMSGIILVAAVAILIGYLTFKALPAVGLDLIFGDTRPLDALLMRKPVFDGLFPAMVGTFFLVIIAVSMALPPGIAAGIYLSEYGRGRFKGFLDLLFDLLAGMPSIVVGLFGFAVTVFVHKHLNDRLFPCLFISAVSLAFLVLPYLIRTTQAALEGIASDIRLIAPALGASKLQNIIHVLMPNALRSIMSGVVLAIGRCAEDTAVIMLTGVVASTGVPRSIWSGYEALPFYIYYISAQYDGPDELARGYGAAMVLLIICAMLFIVAFFIRKRLSTHLLYGR